jgi:thiamine-phosphate pyrophosphorylase
VIRCLITDGTYANDPSRWIDKIRRALAEGIELIQIRERDLPPRDLAGVAKLVMELPERARTKILINDRADIAIASGADGVHLRDGSPEPRIFRSLGLLVTAACHGPEKAAEVEGADYAILAPIFVPLSKAAATPPLGTDAIKEFARRSRVPVLALGGITKENAPDCIRAGAAGIAGVTYFERLTSPRDAHG